MRYTKIELINTISPETIYITFDEYACGAMPSTKQDYRGAMMWSVR